MSLLMNTFEKTSHKSLRPLHRLRGVRGGSHRQLQQLVEQSVAFALDEGVGAARLGYSYPCQSGFLGVGRRRRGQSVRQGGWEVTEDD